jgi:transposase
VKLTDIRDFYAQSANILEPWKVVEVEICPETQSVEVRVECEEGAVWTDPDTRERAHVHEWRERRWRHLDTCEYKTVIIAKIPRLMLPSGKTMTVVVPWSEEGGGSFTKRMEAHLIDVLRECKTTSGAARLAKINIGEAEGVMGRAVRRGLLHREEREMPAVGLDEKAIRKHHRYATVLSDIGRGCVHEVVESRTKEATMAMLRGLPETTRASIEAVAMDMWKGYRGAVGEVLPEAIIVFDRFHVKAHLNKAVDKVRAAEHRELQGVGDDRLKGTKYKWLKSFKDRRVKAAVEFRKLLAHDLRSGEAWGFKELFDKFWNYRSIGAAMRFVTNWTEAVEESGIKPMIKVGQMIDEHLTGLLNHTFYPITNATAEGLNSLIQQLRTAARGLPKFETFRTRVLFHLGKLELHPSL